ncbi:MAG: T9SS type A sorting domain-containing protein [Chitinophagales bacterium]
MKKLFLLALLVIFGLNSNAQTASFVLVANPCDTNKILAVNFSGFGSPPYVVEWPGNSTYSGGYRYDTVYSSTDTLFHYDGAPIYYLYISSSTAYLYSYYAGVTPTLTFTFAPTPTYCGTTGTASVTVTGGTPPYSCYWYTGYTPSSVAGTTNPVTLPSGIYGITIIDATGCIIGTPIVAASSPSMTVGYDTLTNTPTFSISIASTPANCTNGTASVTSVSSGAVSPVSYLWSTGATSPSISSLVTGSYIVTITDAIGCIAHSSAYINQLTTITVNTTPTPATCIANNGAIIGFGSGGATPYTYLWSNGATTQSQTGLLAGSLSLRVTDANGCIGNGYGTITASTPITVTYSATPSLCTSPTGTATLTISGGTLPYTDTFYTSPLQTGITATSLAPGTYPFHVVDAAGCVQHGSVVVPPIDNLILTFAPTPALCTLSNGSLNVSVTGGVPPLTYLWNTAGTTPTITGQPTGYYTVTVTDNNNCAKTKTTYLPFTSPVTVGLSSTPASCIFVNDGIASAIGIGGTSPYSYYWSNGGTTATISSLYTGPYWVYVTDAIGCTSNYYDNYDYVGYNVLDSTCFCTINGTVYDDLNGNCVQDPGEPGINHIQVYCSGIGYTYTDASGNYSFIVPSGSYTISQTVLAYYPLAACQLNNIPVTTSAGIGCVHTVNFADTINPIHDVSISTWDYNHPVPGNTYMQGCIVSNHGTVTESNILGGYNTDGQIFSPAFLPSGIFTGGATYWYNTTGGSGLSLTPGSSQFFFINYAVPTFIPINTNLVFKDSVAYTAPMSNWLTDYSPWNNVNYFTTPVLAGYDPNFIEVSPKGVGVNGDITYSDSILQYMVHFQNTGTYQAQNIVVIDTLDPNLDWTTLQPVYESAPCKITLSTHGVVKFTFNDINLPPASSQPVTSNGMFTYTIKIRHGLSGGAQFRNHASIYFDYNAPVMTNTTLNTLLGTTEINTVGLAQNNSFAIYPNPAGQTFNAIINSDEAGDANMNISDITGKVLMNKIITIQKGIQTITTDASQLAPGIYFVTFNNHGKVQIQKLVIMR